MDKCLLGSTEIAVSRLGLGTVKLGRNTAIKYPHDFKIPDDKAASYLLSFAKDLGINLLDTAPAYGNSEERLGKLLQGERQDWVLVSKAGEEFDGMQSTYNFSANSIIASIKRSLQRLQTDYLDVLLIHSNGEDQKIIEQEQVFETLARLKKEGLIRAYGMSTKTLLGGLLTVSEADVVMVTCHPGYEEEVPVISVAKQKNKGVLIKKAFASGHLSGFAEQGQDPIKNAMRFIFGYPGVTSVITGTINPDHLQQNYTAVKEALFFASY
ncbi:MAG: aldo/keto reductase [Gammaproteobacteria bacterium RIFCSPHIGHO2_12_FULL_35_23]|nr:MAG: aldo/keto reductase [Gammaproteobacteria bacterium RIFCSPHIGHO2_12_FULL_35_23]